VQTRIGVTIHSDDPVVRAGVGSLLRHRPELTLLDRDRRAEAAVLVMCVDAIDDAAITAMRKYWRTGTMRTVLVVGQIREAELFSAVECGVRAIVRRAEASPERLVHAIEVANRGAGDLPPDLLGGILGNLGRSLRTGGAQGDLPLTAFSQREMDVVRLVGEGLETREIAAKLSYSERTVKYVLQAIMLRLNLRNRPHVVAYAAREGYLR
jgi:DNA-binding NarL/FixJ family response regulator